MFQFSEINLTPLACYDTRHRWKYYSTAGLQFDWLRISSLSTYKKQHIFSFGQMQSRQTGDQWYSDPSPYGDLSELDNLTIEIVVYTWRDNDLSARSCIH